MRTTELVVGLGLALGIGSAATVAEAQTRAAASGNPLQALPQINAPRSGPNVTVQVEQPTPQLQQLLASHLTPTKIQVEGVTAISFAEVAGRFTPLVGKDITIGQLIENPLLPKGAPPGPVIRPS